MGAVTDVRELERELPKLWEERFGHAPEVIGAYRQPELLVVLLAKSTTPVEDQIQEQGGQDSARGFRDIVWASVRDELASCVEQMLGQPVWAALHDHDADTDLGVLVFLLVEPADSQDEAVAMDASVNGNPSEALHPAQASPSPTAGAAD